MQDTVSSLLVHPLLRRRELARLKPRDEDIHGIRSWMQHSLKCFTYDDQTMKLLAGPDGYQYLRLELPRISHPIA